MLVVGLLEVILGSGEDFDKEDLAFDMHDCTKQSEEVSAIVMWEDFH